MVPLTVEGITAGNTTRGHRFLSPDAFTVTGFDDYAAKLRRAHVILDSHEREEAIRQQAANLAFARGWEIVPDDALLSEVAGLVEWPVPLMGAIEDRFLTLPPEVLQTSMKEHQKFFSARNPKTGRIEGFVTVANIDAAATAGKWETLLPPVVSKVMKYQGHYVAVPVNVHRVNWLWVNPAVLAKAGAKAPTNFDEFFAAADKIKAAGMVAVAHGGQPWQDATVFESVVLGVGGAAFYDKALVKLDQAALTSPTMVKSFETLGKIKTYIDKDAAGRDWNLATAMVINGKAGMQFMGDWAKGEFTAAGKVPGKDFLCLPAPGTEKSYTFNIDSLAMFKVKSAEEQKAQLTLANAVMSPEFQEVFNLNKGSIPVRSGVSRAKFDSCATRSMDDMAASSKAGTLEPSMAHGMAIDSAKAGAIQDVIAKFMNSSMTPQAAVQALAKAAKTK